MAGNRCILVVRWFFCRQRPRSFLEYLVPTPPKPLKLISTYHVGARDGIFLRGAWILVPKTEPGAGVAAARCCCAQDVGATPCQHEAGKNNACCAASATEGEKLTHKSAATRQNRLIAFIAVSFTRQAGRCRALFQPRPPQWAPATMRTNVKRCFNLFRTPWQ